MARKKQEIALQQEIETQEEWEEALTKEGLLGKKQSSRVTNLQHTLSSLRAFMFNIYTFTSVLLVSHFILLSPVLWFVATLLLVPIIYFHI